MSSVSYAVQLGVGLKYSARGRNNLSIKPLTCSQLDPWQILESARPSTFCLASRENEQVKERVEFSTAKNSDKADVFRIQDFEYHSS